MKRLLWIIELLSFYILSFPLGLVPYRLVKPAGRLLGLMLYTIKKKRRLIAGDALRLAIERGELSTTLSPEEIAKEGFLNLGRSLVEILKVYYGTGRKVLSSVTIEGVENWKQARAKGKGVLFFTGHCGNWELMAVVFAQNLTGVNLLMKPLPNPYFNAIIETMRTRFGNGVIYKSGAVRGILRTLRSAGFVALLIDESVPPEEGALIDFLGKPAWMTKVPALVLKRTTSPVLPIFIRRTNGGHKITIYPEVELSGNETEDTKRISSHIENYIRQNPSQWWLWVQNIWRRGGN